MELVINDVPVAHTLIHQILETYNIKSEMILPLNGIIHILIFFNLEVK